ncbi:LOW QUALITY PROTEIN: hypothetical protein HID58_025480 [Brassica napus]|uniref:Uncharacterized protein n=1 Tax=Brassica napus TaxID=3708 RepID=A0ABQ8CL88_BRANA|nr:LOW QUALITY PROTEIN: hypothetical protein HID58_025480 [Brassica napus]
MDASAVAEPAGSSSSSEVPIESQGSGSDSGSEYREPELRSSDPQGVDAEKPPLREASPETNVNPEVDVLATPTVAEEVVVDGEKSNVKKRGQDCILISCLYPWKTRIKLSLGWITKAREMEGNHLKANMFSCSVILKQGFKALNLERNTKREVFRNYLEPNGILDTLTIGIEFIKV